MAEPKRRAEKLTAQALIELLSRCPQQAMAWIVGITPQSLGQSVCPRRDDRSYNAREVVAHFRARDMAQALERRAAIDSEARTAQNEKDEAQAAKYLVEVGEACRQLLHRGDVETAIARALGTVKQTLEGAPHTWAPLLAQRDALAVRQVLEARVNDVLTQLSRDLQRAFTGDEDDEDSSDE